MLANFDYLYLVTGSVRPFFLMCSSSTLRSYVIPAWVTTGSSMSSYRKSNNMELLSFLQKWFCSRGILESQNSVATLDHWRVFWAIIDEIIGKCCLKQVAYLFQSFFTIHLIAAQIVVHRSLKVGKWHAFDRIMIQPIFYIAPAFFLASFQVPSAT